MTYIESARGRKPLPQGSIMDITMKQNYKKKKVYHSASYQPRPSQAQPPLPPSIVPWVVGAWAWAWAWLVLCEHMRLHH